jgi:hypothetical protein
LFASLSAFARKPPARAKPKAASGPAYDPTHFFASHPGLVRVYEGRARPESDELPPAGASCEVVESKPRDGAAPPALKESCTMIVERKARPATLLTYELRPSGIYNTQVLAAGMKAPQAVEWLVLPAPIKVGAAWKTDRGGVDFERKVSRVGGACRAAERGFADCLVIDVVQKQGKSVVRRYTETYAAGVGLVEDAQWSLVDVKGL